MTPAPEVQFRQEVATKSKKCNKRMEKKNVEIIWNNSARVYMFCEPHKKEIILSGKSFEPTKASGKQNASAGNQHGLNQSDLAKQMCEDCS